MLFYFNHPEQSLEYIKITIILISFLFPLIQDMKLGMEFVPVTEKSRYKFGSREREGKKKKSGRNFLRLFKPNQL